MRKRTWRVIILVASSRLVEERDMEGESFVRFCRERVMKEGDIISDSL